MLKSLSKGISTPIAITIILLLAVSVGGATFWQYSEIKRGGAELPKEREKEPITTFEECVDKGYPVLESNPPQCKTSDGRMFTAKRAGATTTEPREPQIIHKDFYKDFSYPFPLSWTWKEDWRKAEFSLTAVSLGERTVPYFVHSPAHEPGEKINALTLYFKINTHWEDIGVCLPTEIRIDLNEEGDKLAPINNKFNAECPMGDRTYFNQEVIFIVPEEERVFTLTTGGELNIFFTVKALDNGDFEIEREIPVG